MQATAALHLPIVIGSGSEREEWINLRVARLLQKMLEESTRSARSFPDSYIAGDCHGNRALLLRLMDKREEARIGNLFSKTPYSTTADTQM